MQSADKNIRQPAVAGQFYPAEASKLKERLDKYLAAVQEDGLTTIRALLAPHAGYDFSGRVAAYAYKTLLGRRINTAVLLGNAHQNYFRGLAVDQSGAWRTPLGIVELDQNWSARLVNGGHQIIFDHQAHQGDHVLEVQLPWLQTVLQPGFKIVPLLFGKTDVDSYKVLAQTLADNLGNNDLVIVSSDLSHYPVYQEANRIDQETLELIKGLNISRLERHIDKTTNQQVAGEQTLLCGLDGVKTVMRLASLLNWPAPVILKYLNSGDSSAGDKSAVVGYGAMVFGARASGQKVSRSLAAAAAAAGDNNALNLSQQGELLKIARLAVESYIKQGKIPEIKVSDERLRARQGAFVTLKKDGQLRGCIGQIAPAAKPLWQVVRDMALAAASQDYRFHPLSQDELGQLDYEVSVLSAPQAIDDWQQIELGKHGVIVEKGHCCGLFLPQVAKETGWSKEEFLAQLCCQKAGLAPDSYKNDQALRLKVFTAQVFNTYG